MSAPCWGGGQGSAGLAPTPRYTQPGLGGQGGSGTTYILEKPLSISQAVTSAGGELSRRLGGLSWGGTQGEGTWGGLWSLPPPAGGARRGEGTPPTCEEPNPGSGRGSRMLPGTCPLSPRSSCTSHHFLCWSSTCPGDRRDRMEIPKFILPTSTHGWGSFEHPRVGPPACTCSVSPFLTLNSCEFLAWKS